MLKSSEILDLPGRWEILKINWGCYRRENFEFSSFNIAIEMRRKDEIKMKERKIEKYIKIFAYSKI